MPSMETSRAAVLTFALLLSFTRGAIALAN
jgi:hypothetical protein